MTTSHLIDRMPEVARFESEWTREDASHLAVCEECMADWQLVLLALRRRLPLPDLDAERITKTVIARLQAHPQTSALGMESRRPRWWRPVVGLAAAAAVMLTVTLVRSRIDEPVVATAPVHAATMLPELDELLPGEMEVLLASMETEQASQEPIGPLPRLGDLTDVELEQLLKEVEG